MSENGNEHSQEREWMTAAEAAEYAGGVGVCTIREACNRNTLRHIRNWWRNRRADQDAQRMDRRLAGALGAGRRRPLTCSRALGTSRAMRAFRRSLSTEGGREVYGDL